jgi:hypothetical protein
VPPTATEPKFTVVGDTVISAAAGVVVEELAGFDAPVNPMQPEMERVAQSKRSSADMHAGLRLFEVLRSAWISAPPNFTRLNLLSIERILLAGRKTALLSRRTDEGQEQSLTVAVGH